MNIFNIPCEKQNAKLVLLPVPWEVTTSYRGGTSRGPELILNASAQVDFYDIETGMQWKNGYFMEPISDTLLSKNDQARELAQKVINNFETGEEETKVARELKQVNAACEEMNQWVYEHSKQILNDNQFLGVVGGDHSTPFGAIRALSEKHNHDFGILHIDAHADLRMAYEGFTYSHASIMYNVMSSNFAPKRLVQVAIRDFCKEEKDYIDQSGGRIRTFFDHHIKSRQMSGESFREIAEDIIEQLPKKVYVSFDIDGLIPTLCPRTGTPVPGGLQFEEALCLFSTIAESGRQIIGFDLNEVSPGPEHDFDNEWDGNVGARILSKLCGWTMATNGFTKEL